MTWGHEVHPGYFGQEHDAVHAGDHDESTILSWLWTYAPDRNEGFVRGKLAEVLFGKDDVGKKLTSLSGGEASRLVMAQLGLLEPNLLILDEPTNHLDVEGIEALAAGLDAFDGTIVFVSHDRWFVSEIATRILELRRDGIEDYRGTYAEYLAHCGDDHLDVETAYQRARAEQRKGA